MSLAYRELRSGLVLAEDSMDEAQLSRALKQIDDRLCLQKHRAEVGGGWVYKVICVVSDTQAPIVLTWTDEYGNPLPLSSGLIDKFNRQRREVRERHGIPDADEHNRRHVEETAAAARARACEVVADHEARLARSRTTVSMAPGSSLAYWQRNKSRPKSGRAR